MNIEAAVGGGEIGENAAAQFENVQGAELFVEDFAVRIEEDGVGDGGIPLGIESFLHGLGVGGVEEEIASGGMEMLEHAEDAFAFVGLIGGDEDVVDVADAVHAERFFEFGEFVDAGAAPGGPEIDERVFLGWVGTEGF